MTHYVNIGVDYELGIDGAPQNDACAHALAKIACDSGNLVGGDQWGCNELKELDAR